MHGTLDAPTPPRRRHLPVVLRLALRELRAGLAGFAVFIACIALGVGAISGVASIARSLVEGVASQSRVILGGDASFSMVGREAGPPERAFLERTGTVSLVQTLRGMAVAGTDGASLVEIKAVDAAYPVTGTLVTDPPATPPALFGRRGDAWGAVADPALFARLDVKTGDRLTIGGATFVITAALVSEPDKIATGLGFGPRLLMSSEALAATGLVGPGSLVRRVYRVALPPGRDDDEALRATVAEAGRAFPDAGWEIRTRENADPRFVNNIRRFTQFLTLVGLTALLVGGVGVANAVTAFVDRKRRSVAILKSIGATGGRVVAIYLLQVMMIAAIGVAIGLAIGAVMPFAATGAIRSLLPVPIAPVVSAQDLALAALYGFLTALTFSVLPLGRAHDITVSGLFRDRIAPDRRWPRPIYAATAIGAGLLLVAVAVLASHDRRIAVTFIAAAGAAFLLLRVVAQGVMAIARRLPHARNPSVRLAIANLHRPGALTPTLVLSLGLGITLLVTIAVIDTNLRREIGSTLPDRAPNFFFVDVSSGEAEAFRGFLRGQAPNGRVEEVPMMRGRITALRGRPTSEIKAASEVAWVLDGDRGITYADTVPEGSTVVAGEWWGPGHAGPPLVSFDKEAADGLGLSVGDEVTVNVLGRSLTARIANLRRIDWRRLGISFVMVFSPNTFAGAPHTALMTITIPPAEAGAIEPRLLRDVARAYPAVTSVRVKDALDAVNDIVSQLVLAIRVASGVALASSFLVLGGALAAGHRARLYDAVVLKTLGATRWRLLSAYLVEYGALGLATAIFGIVAGTGAAWLVVARIMGLSFSPALGSAALSAGAATVVAIVIGLAGTWRILGQKPAPYLRDL